MLTSTKTCNETMLRFVFRISPPLWAESWAPGRVEWAKLERETINCILRQIYGKLLKYSTQQQGQAYLYMYSLLTAELRWH